MKALVVSGTLGAGKTHTAAAIRDVLAARGRRVAVIDLDWLCQCDPAPAEDPYNNALGFANLASVYPNYAAAGVDYLVLARIVADRQDRARYQWALAGAEVRIVLLTASSGVRRDRIVNREPAGPWRDGHLHRTDPVANVLAGLAVEDLTVDTDDRTGSDVAHEILEALGLVIASHGSNQLSTSAAISGCSRTVRPALNWTAASPGVKLNGEGLRAAP